MFSKLFAKINTMADHHQIMIGIILGFSTICLIWGIEKLLEKYLFPKQPVIGYLLAALGGLVMLWLTKHFIMHVI